MIRRRYHDEEYLRLLQDVLDNGVRKTDRTGTGTTSLFGTSMRFDISDNSIPLLTTKKMNLNSVIHEIIWYLSGDTNIKYLNDNGVNIWNAWADADGDLGPIYSQQWRKTPNYVIYDNDCIEFHPEEPYIDQIQTVIDLIKTDPTSRRIMVNSWNVGQLHEMRLPPCHYQFSFWCQPYTRLQRLQILTDKLPRGTAIHDEEKCFEFWNVPKGEIKCKLDMRSNDMFLGNPFNIAQYAIISHMIAQVTGYEATELFYTCTDSHIYDNHLEQVKEQLSRDSRTYESPTISLNKTINNIDYFTFSDIEVVGYNHLDAIKAPVAI